MKRADHFTQKDVEEILLTILIPSLAYIFSREF